MAAIPAQRTRLFHVAWYTAIAAVQAILALKYLDRRQRDKAAA